MEVPEELMRGAHELRSTASNAHHEPDTNSLLQWFKSEHHGQIHQSLEVFKSPGSGLSFRVSETGSTTITAGEPVVVCPLSVSLSYLNAIGGGHPLGRSLNCTEESSTAFSPEFMQKVPAHVIGRFFLIQQFLQGTASAWTPYVATLPQPQDFDTWALPAVWPKDSTALRLLEGTNAEVAAAEMRQRIESEFRAAWGLLRDPAYTFALYEWAYCIFTSRSFRPSLVLTEDVKAALTQDGADNHHRGMVNHARLPEGCGIDDFSLLLPVLDIGNHDPRAVIKWQPVVGASRTSLEGSAVLTTAPADTTDQAIVFYTGTAYNKGQQVFNNYGSKSNSELLVGYGFVLAPTDDMHNDYVHLRKRGALGPSIADEAAGSGNTPPHDFLLSLRPIGEPSSIVGRARLAPENRVDKTPTSKRSPGFTIIDDGLLWDMLSLMLSPDARDEIQRYAVAQVKGQQSYLTAPMEEVQAAVPASELLSTILDLVFRTHDSEDTPPLLVQIGTQVRMNLLYKFDNDLEILQAKDAELGDISPKSSQERVALQYREQYMGVLSNALDVLGSEVEGDDGEDEEESENEDDE
ncbi:hypothetical protein SEUCBS140593_002328 [Sporothrix eucalyptigena]|uniref:SET domain-containing protein n=1 Tax=Sporothrix eucalyptigena TaxID=1812306 RepID=A0ABP0B5S2_9PEZI